MAFSRKNLVRLYNMAKVSSMNSRGKKALKITPTKGLINQGATALKGAVSMVRVAIIADKKNVNALKKVAATAKGVKTAEKNAYSAIKKATAAAKAITRAQQKNKDAIAKAKKANLVVSKAKNSVNTSINNVNKKIKTIENVNMSNALKIRRALVSEFENQKKAMAKKAPAKKAPAKKAPAKKAMAKKASRPYFNMKLFRALMK